MKRPTPEETLTLIPQHLSQTTEPYDDWEWDGEELIIYLNNEPIERYSKEIVYTYLLKTLPLSPSPHPPSPPLQQLTFNI